MSARAQQDRAVVALAAVACGRLSGAATVQAGRGGCRASADQYRVTVTEPGMSARRGRGPQPSPEIVYEHWGGDAEMLAFRSPVLGATSPSGALDRARVAARMMRYYQLDSLQIAYPDGAELHGHGPGLVLYGPRRGVLRRRPRVLRTTVDQLL